MTGEDIKDDANEQDELDREDRSGEFTIDWSESDHDIVVVSKSQGKQHGKRLEVRTGISGDTITLQTEEHLSGDIGAGYAFRAKNIDEIFLESSE